MVARMMAPMARALRAMLGRGTVSASNSATRMQTLQLELMADEVKDVVEHMEPYGFTSRPQVGAEVVAGFFDGDRSHGVALVVADRRYRITGLAAGEVAIHDDQGQAVVITRAGIEVRAAGKPVKITNAPRVDMQTPILAVTGAIQAGSSITSGANITAAGNVADQGGAKTMAAMRATFNGHTHVETGSTTNPTASSM